MAEDQVVIYLANIEWVAGVDGKVKPSEAKAIVLIKRTRFLKSE
jgi:hypothetical protein